MMHAGSVFEQIVALISRRTGIPAAEVRLNARLLHDLGITGDDAEELLDEFAGLFEVDMEEFSFDEYFTDEPSVLHLCWVLGVKKRPIWENKKELTVSELLEAARRRRWNS
jgi:hypothetical protein